MTSAYMLCTVYMLHDFAAVFIMIYYAIRQQIKYNGIQLKHRYKIYGRQTI